MTPKKIINTKRGPEREIQDRLMVLLRGKGWFVKETHGNVFQKGFPDLYCTHVKWGIRWVEVKNLAKFAFTAAQLEEFPLFVANGSHIWVLTDATEAEYKKLFGPMNWWQFLSVMK